MPPSDQIMKIDINVMVKNLWHLKALANIQKQFNYILENNTFIGTQYLHYAEKMTREGERNEPGG